MARAAGAAAAPVAAAGLFAVAIFQFARARTTVNPMKPESASALVVDGAFRVSRNPIYLADLGLLLAWALNRFQIGPEERALEAKFGAAFTQYRLAVRRWL